MVSGLFILIIPYTTYYMREPRPDPTCSAQGGGTSAAPATRETVKGLGLRSPPKHKDQGLGFGFRGVRMLGSCASARELERGHADNPTLPYTLDLVEESAHHPS